MHAFLFHNLNTVRGAANGTVTQPQDDWLDLSPYQDVIFHTDCKELTGTTVTIEFDTAPAMDENLFSAMTTFVLTTGVTISKILLSQNPSVPLARWVRWKITGPAVVWDATFKVLVTANPSV